MGVWEYGSMGVWEYGSVICCGMNSVRVVTKKLWALSLMNHFP
jgi:hypothetical protein